MVINLPYGYYYFYTKYDYLGFCRTYKIEPYVSEWEQYIVDIRHGKCTYTCQDTMGYDFWCIGEVKPTRYIYKKVLPW